MQSNNRYIIQKIFGYVPAIQMQGIYEWHQHNKADQLMRRALKSRTGEEKLKMVEQSWTILQETQDQRRLIDGIKK